MRELALSAFLMASTAMAQSPLPFDIGGSFELTDQNGAQRTEANPEGHPQLLFFGYVNCQAICDAALPTMAGLAHKLAEAGQPVTPVMVTVAPEQDTVDTIGGPLERLHPGFVGLTGSASELERAYTAFAIEREPLFEDPEYGWVYAHGSFIYLLDAEGTPLTLIPPVLSVDEAKDIAERYLSPDMSN